MEIFKWALQKAKFQGFCSNFALHHRGLMYHLAGILPLCLTHLHLQGRVRNVLLQSLGAPGPITSKTESMEVNWPEILLALSKGKFWSQLLLKEIPHCKSMVGGLFTPSKEKD